MNSEWDWVRLGDYCSKIGSGATPSGGKDTYLDIGPFCLIRSQNIYNDGFTPSGLAYISTEQAKRLDSVSVDENDILLNITGDSVARVCLALAKYLPARVNQHVAIIRPLQGKLDSRFLRYFLASPYQQDLMLGMAAAGATRNALTKAMIENFKVPCPPLQVQQKIACVLASLDDRIALLCETNATMEAMAQALFKSWFVDFDPVHANAGTRAATLPAELQALFPSTFTDTPQGLAPQGWTWQALEDAYELNPKRNLKKGTLANYLDMASVGTSGHTTEETINREFGSGTKFVNGDTLLARITPCLENGKTAFVDFLEDGETGWGSTEFIVLKPKAPLPPYHAYLLARFPGFREYAIQSMSGTSGRQRVQNDVLGRYMLAVPDDAVAEAFGQLVEVMQQKIQANHQQAQNLSSLRDTMLPRLISGQLRLPEVEDLLEEYN